MSRLETPDWAHYSEKVGKTIENNIRDDNETILRRPCGGETPKF